MIEEIPMTAVDTTVSSRFQDAAVLYARHRARTDAAGLDAAKLDAAKLDVTHDTTLLREALSFLVGFGYLSAEQADALWGVLTGDNGFIQLPVLPFPQGRAGSIIYDTIRGAVAAKNNSVDAGALDTIGMIAEAVVAVVDAIETVGGAISDAISFLGGLFG
jgi:hypothetical protein